MQILKYLLFLNLLSYEPQTIIPAYAPAHLRERPERIVNFSPAPTTAAQPQTVQKMTDIEQIKGQLANLDRKVDLILCVVFEVFSLKQNVLRKSKS